MKLRITIAGNTYEVDVEILEEEDAPPPYVAPPPPAYSPMAIPVPAQSSPVANQYDPSENICRSPVTGLVIRIPVEPGQTVEANQLLMVLEAMKMETRVVAPRAATIQQLYVAPGNSVKSNQPLLELEWDTSSTGESQP